TQTYDGVTTNNGITTEQDKDSFTYTVTDAHGNTTTGSILVDIVDDVPTAHANTNSVSEGAQASGNVLTDGTADVLGADGAAPGGAVTGVATGSNVSNPVSGNLGGAGIAGQYGTLVLGANGAYTYTANPNAVTTNAVDHFVYTITDGDGDTSTVTLDITVNNVTVTASDTDALVSEKGLATGSDAAGNSEIFNGAITPAGGTGPYTYTLTSPASGSYGNLVLNANGTYTYTLTQTYDGVTTNNGITTEQDKDSFTYTVTDAHGNTTTGSILVDIVDDVPAFTLVNDGNGDGIVSLSAFNPATATTYTGQFAEWHYGADGFGSVTATGPNVEVASTSSSQIVLNLKEGGEVVAKLTLNADGTDSLEVLHRAGEVVFNPIAATSATAGGPTGSLLVVLGATADFNIIVTGDDGVAPTGQSGDTVNTSNQGWAVKGDSGQSNDPSESIKFAFVNDSNNTTPHGIDDFKFTTEGYTGGMATANITVLVYTDATHYDQVTLSVTEGQVVQISQLDWSAIAGTSNYVAGDDIYAVKIISDASNGGGFRLNGVEVGAASENPPPDLDFNGITVTVTDGDGDTATQTFNVHVDGTAGNQLTVEAIAGTSGNDNLAGTASSDSLIGGAGNDTLTGGAGADRMTGGIGADTFVIGAGDSTPVIGGSGNAGTISGYDIITDFVAGTDKLTLPGTLVAATGGNVNGGNSTLTISGDTVQSHSVTNGIVSFFGTDTFTAPLAVTSTASLAAVVQYLTITDIGNAGATLAFTATIAAVSHTFVYTQSGADAGVGTLVDLQGVTVANLNTLIGGSVDPIILDLNQDGFAFSDVNHGVQFDMNGDGAKEQLAWNSSNDGMLAVDLNHDGKIDDGTELFTPNFGGGNFASGAAALASLDSNHDGLIDHNDTAFDSLLIWKDANANGASDAGELSHLADNGIVSISTAATPTVGEIDGQTVTGNGTFHMADGTTGNYVEVELDTSLVAPAEPTAGTAGADTFKLDNLDIKDLITDYHGTGPGGEGDKIDLSALFDTAPGGDINDYVHYDAETKTLSVDTTGSGNAANFVDVAALQNAPAAGTITILYDDTAHVQHTATI
ncbi:type I secretion C-terminal target domain-containing protein, partial [Mesorhizobium sp. M7A.T.Ca.TU.009.02.1.1]